MVTAEPQESYTSSSYQYSLSYYLPVLYSLTRTHSNAYSLIYLVLYSLLTLAHAAQTPGTSDNSIGAGSSRDISGADGGCGFACLVLGCVGCASMSIPSDMPEHRPVGLHPAQPRQAQQGQCGLQQPQQVAQERKGTAHAEVSQTVYCCAASSTSGLVKSR